MRGREHGLTGNAIAEEENQRRLGESAVRQNRLALVVAEPAEQRTAHLMLADMRYNIRRGGRDAPRRMAVFYRPGAVCVDLRLVRDDLDRVRVLLADEVGEDCTDDGGHPAACASVRIGILRHSISSRGTRTETRRGRGGEENEEDRPDGDGGGRWEIAAAPLRTWR